MWDEFDRFVEKQCGGRGQAVRCREWWEMRSEIRWVSQSWHEFGFYSACAESPLWGGGDKIFANHTLVRNLQFKNIRNS